MKTVIIFLIGYFLSQQGEHTVKLPYGFDIRSSDSEDYGKYITYSSIQISRNGKQVYKAKDVKEYKFTNKYYPKVFKVSDTEYQIILEVDNRPFGDLSEIIYIQSSRIYKTDVLPIFVNAPKNLDSDSTLELAGTWSFGEEWKGKNGDIVVAYCPILFYEVSQNGLTFDSITTQKVNKRIYGNYYGSQYNEKIEFPKIKWQQTFYKELHRIQK